MLRRVWLRGPSPCRAPQRPQPAPLQQQSWQRLYPQPYHARVVRVVAVRDPHDILGVPRTASVSDIKKAFRKRALKLHPDVSKAPDARERFMEAKQAYQQLLDEREGRGSGARGGTSSSSSGFGSRGSSAGADSSRWGYGTGGRSASGGAGYGQGQQQWRQPEETYSFGDLLRDLDKELSDYARQRQARRGGLGSAATAGVPKSLWEELYDIGEEFVEFLEQGLGVSDDEASAYGDLKRKYGDLSGGTRATGSASGGASSGGSTAASSSSAGASRPGGNTGASTSSSSSAAYDPAMQKKLSAQYVEDELEALKRKLGKK